MFKVYTISSCIGLTHVVYQELQVIELLVENFKVRENCLENWLTVEVTVEVTVKATAEATVEATVEVTIEATVDVTVEVTVAFRLSDIFSLR